MTIRLTLEQIERYSRQILIPDLGGKGQIRLLQRKVLVIGAGGLGCPAAFYLAAYRMETDINFRVQTVELVFGRVYLLPAQVLCGVKNLPLQIRYLHLIAINDPQGPNTGRCEVKGRRAAQSPSSNHQDLPLE